MAAFRAKGEPPHMAQGEHVCTIPIGRSVIRLEIRIVQQRNQITGSMVERPAIGVRSREAQILAKPLAQAGLQRVVVAGEPGSTLDGAGRARGLRSIERLPGGARSRISRVDLPAV